MKKFAKNILVFLVLYLVLANALNLLLPDYYGNSCYKTKFEYYKRNKADYNAVVFGSSRLYRHLNPKKLDSLSSSEKLHTFNLACPSTFNPEVYYLYDKFLRETEGHTVKVAFMELQALNTIASRNINTAHNYYWINPALLWYALSYSYVSDYSVLKKLWAVGSYSLSYACKLVVIQNIKYFRDEGNPEVIGKDKNGFYSLDQELENARGTVIELQKRHDAFLKDTMITQQRIRHSLVVNQVEPRAENLNKVHLKKISLLIKESAKKGIHLYFVIPPRLSSYENLYALKKQIPADHFLDISNARKYPLLYQTDYSFDIGHLNEKGANLFTQYLAAEIAKKDF